MKSEIRHLMKENNIEALLITGAGQHNPAMVYLTGGGHMTSADLVFPAGGQEVLYCRLMERDEAKKSGLKTELITKFPYQDYLSESNGDQAMAMAIRYKAMLHKSNIESGRVMLYGVGEINKTYPVYKALQSLLPEVELFGNNEIDILQKAMMCKSTEEIARIQHMGEITVEVVERVAEFLTNQNVENEVLIQQDGRPLRIEDVKNRINFWLAELGAENPEGTIFAIGHDAGAPHSVGNPNDYLVLGKTIVFDIFPCEAGGGYFHDFTRTWSLGYATDEVTKVYEDVKKVYDTIASSLTKGTVFKQYQKQTCDLFEGLGHMTICNDTNTLEGYIHSLGHGVGLNIHEYPFSGYTAGDDEILSPGTVFTIEPGLYYPSRDLGVRLEDTYVTKEDGTFSTLIDYPMDLILRMK